MADDIQFRIKAYDEATSAFKYLGAYLRGLSADVEKYNRAWGSFAAGRYVSRQIAETTAELEQQAEVFVRLQQTSGNVNYQNIINAQTGVSGSFKSAAESAKAFGASLSKVEEGANRLGYGLRHVVAIFDESLRGQRGAMIASTSALIRDTGLLATITSNLASPWTAVGVAGAAALAAIAYAAEQAYQRMSAIRTLQTGLALQGMGAGSGQQSALGAEFDADKSATHEYAGTIREVWTELARLPPAAQESRQAFYDAAIALGQLQHEDPAKAIEPFLKAAEKSPEALAQLIESTRGLKDVLGPTGQTLTELTKNTNNATEAYRNLSGQLVRPELLEAGKSSREAANSLESWTEALQSAEGGVTALYLGTNTLADKMGKAANALKDVTIASDGVTAAMRTQGAAIEAGNEPLDHRIRLLQQMVAAQEGASRIGGEVGEFGDPAAAQRAGNAARNLGAEAQRGALQPGEAAEHERNEQAIRAQAEARHADLQAQKQAAVAEEAEARRVANIRTPGNQGLVDTSLEVITAHNKVLEVDKKIADQSVQLDIDAERAKVANEARGTQERIDAQNRIIALEKQRVAAGRAGPEAVAQAEIQLANLQRQFATKSFQEARDLAREQVELAKGNVTEIMAAYDRLRAAASTTGQAPAVGAQINREEVRDLQSAQSQAFTKETEFNSAMERQDDLRIAAMKASLQAQVAAHAISKEEMANKEEQFTQTIRAQEEKRVEAELNTINLTDEQKQRLYEHLAELRSRDAEEQVQSEEKVTQAIETENAKRVKMFAEGFNKIGEGIDKALIDAVEHKRGGNPMLELSRSLFESTVHTAGDFASKAAGGFIGPKLGLTEEQSKGGLGDVLGNALAKSLGLLKTPPKSGMDTAAEKWTAALQAQQKATDLQQKAGETLQKAGEALLNATKGGTPTTGAGAGAGASGSGTGPSGVPSNVQRGGPHQVTDNQWLNENAPFPTLAHPDRPMAGSTDKPYSGPPVYGPGSPFGSQAPAGQQNPLWNSSMQQLQTSTHQVAQAQETQTTTITANNQAVQTNAQDVTQAANAANQFSSAAKQTSTSLGASGGGGGGGGVIGATQQLTGQLGRVSPALGDFSSILGVAKSAVALFSSATSAASAASAAGGVAKTGLLGLGFLGLAGGTGATPGGMILVGEQGPELLYQPGGLGVMNNRDTRSFLSSSGGFGGGLAPGSMPSFPPPHFAAGTSDHSVSTSNMTYAPQISGRFGGMSRSEVGSILRSHGDAFMATARNFIRNGSFGYG